MDYWSPTITLNAGFEVVGGTALVASPTTFPCCPVVMGIEDNQPTVEVAAEKSSPNTHLLLVSPNPFGSTVQVTYEIIDELNKSQLYMTDISGKIVKNIKLNAENKGSQSIEINTSDLMNGIYFIHFYNGIRSEIQKIVKANKD